MTIGTEDLTPDRPDESVHNTGPEDGENRHITSDGQPCECADHADIVDGRCRRCGLTGTAPEPVEPVAETPEEIPVVEAPVTVVAPE